MDRNSPFALREAYKSTRTNLLSILSVHEDLPKQICFTSPESADGKTLNCSNIAQSFAEMGAKVLVIDADMRKPKLHRVFKVPVSPGLSDYLGNFCDIDKAIVAYKGVDGLYVMPSGKLPPNPTELILSSKFNHLLKLLEEKFDYVFIDAPPACIVTDAAIIAKKTLGAVIVCRSGVTRNDMAKKAKTEIEQGGGKVLCALLNGVDFAKSSNSVKGHKYRYYQDSYGDSPDDIELMNEEID
ncbi:MAG: CpsD/CapB family tyrosine-protein kinase [Clostridia bacterium]|nr:CpsD/CapB family tyrosine-protein kinase [Clostridia bacterium]